MTTERQVTIMHAAAILKGLAIDLTDQYLWQDLNGLAAVVVADAAAEREDWIANCRKAIADMRADLIERDSIASVIMSEALGGVIHLLIP